MEEKNRKTQKKKKSRKRPIVSPPEDRSEKKADNGCDISDDAAVICDIPISERSEIPLCIEPKRENAPPFDVYPRPMLRRNSFINLNGLWDLFIPGKKGSIEKKKILVPFPPESVSSGIGRKIPKGKTVIYHRFFSEEIRQGKRLLLHFGAVDGICRVFVNSYLAAEHSNGYLPFEADVTDYLKSGTKKNEITVECEEPLGKLYPRGKQSSNPHGMWYTGISGIWQSVWAEWVPDNYIKDVKITTDHGRVTIRISGGDTEKKLTVSTPSGSLKKNFTGDECSFDICGVRYWSPEEPYLYEYTLECGEDLIAGYFACRDIGTENGILSLNGKPVYLHGVLDQGYYQDGIFTPPSPDELKHDLSLLKELGFNTVRKHLKIEPLYFYYLCDSLGILVIQDMVCNGAYSFFLDSFLPTIGMKNLPCRVADKNQIGIFRDSMLGTSSLLFGSPSVVIYTIYNEGWGQISEKKLDAYDLLKENANGRLIDTASGWKRNVVSDFRSEHKYFGKLSAVRISDTQPTLLSEYGGISYTIKDHSVKGKKYGYKFSKTEKQYADSLDHLVKNGLIPLIEKGLAGSIYTQLYDVERETNGLLTYDRKILKADKNKLKDLSALIYKVFEATHKSKKRNGETSK